MLISEEKCALCGAEAVSRIQEWFDGYWTWPHCPADAFVCKEHYMMLFGSFIEKYGYPGRNVPC